MPIQKSIVLDNGIELPVAYIVINRLDFNYSTSEVNILIGIYKDSTTYAAGKPEVLSSNYYCSGDNFETYFEESVLALAGNTPLIKGYEWLLSLPIYNGATEVE